MTRTRRPSRSRLVNARSMWRGRRRSIGTVRRISSRTACCTELGLMRLRTHLRRDALGRVDHRVPGRDRGERALEHDQRAEERAPLGRQRDAVVEHQPQHRVEHRGVGLRAGREVLRHEPRQRAFEVVDVDAAPQARDLQHRLRDRVGVAAAHPGHEVAERGLLHRVEPPGGAEVDERELPVGQQHHVARDAGRRGTRRPAASARGTCAGASRRASRGRRPRRRSSRPRARSCRRATPSRARATC